MPNIEKTKKNTTRAYPPRSKAVRLKQQQVMMATYKDSPERKQIMEEVMEFLRAERRQDLALRRQYKLK